MKGFHRDGVSKTDCGKLGRTGNFTSITFLRQRRAEVGKRGGGREKEFQCKLREMDVNIHLNSQ